METRLPMDPDILELEYLIITMAMGNAKGWAKKGQAWQKQGVSMTL
jgi:hypothetical protein